LGLTWVIGGKDAQPPLPPPPDTDGDGLIDAEDACPNIPGEDGKGCPWGDKDADNIKDNVDKCPDVAGIEPDGCPDPDPDKDGILAPADQCPDVAGVAPDGCPDTDPDKDGIPSDVDKCPDQPETVNGFEDADGCPDEVPEEVKKFTGVIEGIYFDLGKATIRARSHQVLNAAVKLLGDYPSLKLRISGHTDSTGTRERNLDLSAERAESVKTYMVEQGVDASRLETVGVGPDKPIGDNKTKQGRAENRRIEFEVIK
jgi:outer membrane protein OmpA-like peptidoglycan-associated protein